MLLHILICEKQKESLKCGGSSLKSFIALITQVSSRRFLKLLHLKILRGCKKGELLDLGQNFNFRSQHFSGKDFAWFITDYFAKNLSNFLVLLQSWKPCWSSFSCFLWLHELKFNSLTRSDFEKVLNHLSFLKNF